MKFVLRSATAVGLAAAMAASFAVAAQQAPASPATSVQSSEADNTRLNKRDRPSEAPTPMRQSNEKADIDLVAKVRQAIVDDESLSMKAHNVKLIANQGVVILRGPVVSEDEKVKVGQIVAGIAGVSRVDNRLDIEQNKSN